MFCNGPRTDEGDIARLGPTTIAGMTSLKVLFVLDHDYGRYRWFGSAHQLPPYSWGRPYLQTVAGIWGGLFIFARMHILGWVWLDILHIYMSLPLLLLLFFFFLFFFFVCDAWGSVLHWWLTGGVAHVVATCSISIGWEASFPVEIFLVSRIFRGKRPFDINLSFLLFLPLATFLLSFCVWCLQLPMLHISPFVFSVSP